MEKNQEKIEEYEKMGNEKTQKITKVSLSYFKKTKYFEGFESRARCLKI